MMTSPSWQRWEHSGDTQYARVPLDQIGLGSGHATISIMWIATCFDIQSNTQNIAYK